MGLNMKRTTIVLVMLAIATLLVACQKDPFVFSGGTQGKGNFSFSQTQTEEKTEYVLGTASRRIHRCDCPYVEKIKEENRLPCLDIRQAEAEGYTPCSQCLLEKPNTNSREEEQTK